MRRHQVVMAGVVASVVCGALCGLLVGASFADIRSLTPAAAVTRGPAATAEALRDSVTLCLLGVGVGAFVGGVLGPAPTAVVVLVWGVLRARLSADGAVRAASLVVAGVVVVEVGLVQRELTGGWVAGLAVLCGLVAGACAWVVLPAELRSTRARDARRTY